MDAIGIFTFCFFAFCLFALLFTFLGSVDENVIYVSDLGVGSYVLVLPRRSEDLGWAPVVVNENTGSRKLARLTWFHPQCLEYVTSDSNAIVTI